MKIAFHLANCNTCQRIIKELELTDDFVLQNIKTEAITKKQIEQMKKMTGSYESLFSRRSMKYRAMGLHEKDLTEKDYKELILSEYTFLKRPVFIMEDEIFVGNTKAVVAAAKAKLKAL